jgi:HEAT repeat protein
VTNVFEDDPEIRDIQNRLQDEDGEVRRIALLDLADVAGDEHVPLIIAALRDPIASRCVQKLRMRWKHLKPTMASSG